MDFKFKAGEYVRYSISGVCLIEGIQEMDIMGDGNKRMFYVLKPTSRKGSTIYVPVDNESLTSKMEYTISRDEVDRLIDGMGENSLLWIEDKKRRTEEFKSIIKNCNRQELLSLVECIYKRRDQLKEAGKALSSADETFLNQAEGIIENEFAYALNIDDSVVGDYIAQKLEN